MQNLQLQESSYKPSPIHCRYKIKLSPKASSPHFKSSAELSRNIPVKSLKQIFLKSPETFHRKPFPDHSPCKFPFWMCSSGFLGVIKVPRCSRTVLTCGNLTPILVLFGIPAQGCFYELQSCLGGAGGGFKVWCDSDRADLRRPSFEQSLSCSCSRCHEEPPHSLGGFCMARMPK